MLTARPQTLPYFLNTCHDSSFKFGHFSFQNVKSPALIKTAELPRILLPLFDDYHHNWRPLYWYRQKSPKQSLKISTNINQSNKFRSGKLTTDWNFFFFSICRYQIMLECWDEDPNNRPTFERLHETITGFLKEEVDNSILSFLIIHLAIILNRSRPTFWTSQSSFLSWNCFFFTCQHPFIDKTMVVNTPAEPNARVLVLG